MPDGDGTPGSAHATQPRTSFTVTFVPEYVAQERRVFHAESFTEVVILLQHMWEPRDSYVEIRPESVQS